MVFRLLKETDILGNLEKNLEEPGVRSGLTERDRYQMRLALDELVTNTSSYGFDKGQGSRIDIELIIRPGDCYEITYSDDAPMFDPFSNPVDEGKSGTEEKGFGGFGIALVKKIMDSVFYEFRDGENIIYLRKSLRNEVT